MTKVFLQIRTADESEGILTGGDTGDLTYPLKTESLDTRAEALTPQQIVEALQELDADDLYNVIEGLTSKDTF